MLVQFGNNWIQRIPLTAKLDSAYGLVQFWMSSEFFHPIISKLDKHVVLLHIHTGYTYVYIPAKLDSAYGLVQFWLPTEFFSSNYFQIGQACSPITYTYRIAFAPARKPNQIGLLFTHKNGEIAGAISVKELKT